MEERRAVLLQSAEGPLAKLGSSPILKSAEGLQYRMEVEVRFLPGELAPMLKEIRREYVRQLINVRSM
jgi:hypothetical protein